MVRLYSTSVVLALAALIAPAAHAELDPELKVLSPKNDTTMFVNGTVGFGQAHAVSAKTPGIFYKATVEPGFLFRRDSWNRIEASIEAGFGSMKFGTSGGNVTMPIGFMALAKFGYGWSLGSDAFFVARTGVGPMAVQYQQETDAGITFRSTSSMWGVAVMGGGDFVAKLTDTFDFVGGLSITHAQFTIDEIKGNGLKLSVNEPLNINIPTINLGLRLTL